MKKLTDFVDLHATAIFLAIAAVGGYFASLWFNIPYWIAVCLVALAMFVNGLIIMLGEKKPPPDSK